MGRAKKNPLADALTADGRKYNGRKKGDKRRNQPKITPAKLNKAKKDRQRVYAINALRTVYGHEEKFWEQVAEKALKSFNYAKLITEYAYGRPTEPSGGKQSNQAPVINFFGEPKQQIDNTVDISHEEQD